MHVGVGVHAAGNGACFSACLYDGHCRPFLRLRDGTHPLAVGPVKPRPLDPGQADQTGSAGGCQKKLGPGRQIVLAGQPERRQPNRRSGRDPGPDLTPASSQDQGSRAGSTIHSLPAGPEALSTLSLPGRKRYPHSPCRIGVVGSSAGACALRHAYQPVLDRVPGRTVPSAVAGYVCPARGFPCGC